VGEKVGDLNLKIQQNITASFNIPLKEAVMF
jgi:hypothetical protein